jgi:predicted metal-dependent phosphotriesterase family hydrolase
MRVYAQILHEKGFTEEAIAQMAIKNPAYVLGVTEKAE